MIAARLSTAIAFVFLAVGCSRTEAVYSVHGRVLLDDMPLAEAYIVFHPLTKDDRRWATFSDDRGEFALTTHQPNDGAPSGEYSVSVEFRDRIQEGDEWVRSGANLIPARYANPELSGLRCTIHPTSNNELEPFSLSSRP